MPFQEFRPAGHEEIPDQVRNDVNGDWGHEAPNL